LEGLICVVLVFVAGEMQTVNDNFKTFVPQFLFSPYLSTPCLPNQNQFETPQAEKTPKTTITNDARVTDTDIADIAVLALDTDPGPDRDPVLDLDLGLVQFRNLVCLPNSFQIMHQNQTLVHSSGNQF